MPWGVAAAGVAAAAGGIGASYLGSQANQKAANQANDFNRHVYDDTTAKLQPYLDFGTAQLPGLTDVLNNKNPSNYIDPGYAFRLKSGTNAIMNNAASAGMAESGDTLRALEEYGQNMGSQEYGNAFSRWLSELQARENLADIGENAAVQQGHVGQNAATNVGNLATSGIYGGPYATLGNGLASAGGAGMNAFARTYGRQTPGAGANSVGGGVMANNPGLAGYYDDTQMAGDPLAGYYVG